MNLTPYGEFVQSRFKTFPTLRESLLHAAVGISGEVAEFIAADTRAGQMEELGDIEFYLEAGRQQFTLMMEGLAVIPTQEVYDWFGSEKDERECFMTAQMAVVNWPLVMVIEAGSIIDLVKKLWAYNKPFDEPLSQNLGAALRTMRINLDSAYEAYGFSKGQIQLDNQAKLEKRYPTGYSDAAAIARADKVEETQE